MADYDSDSSGGDLEYTETKTLLGYTSKEPGDDTISRLGGRPEWIDPNKPPSAALARCAACNDMMVLLLQLNGELPDRFPGHERRIYVFACRRPRCQRKQGSIRVVRGVRVSREAREAEEKRRQKEEEDKRRRAEEARTAKEVRDPRLGETLFGGKGLGSAGGANPFASGGGGAGNPFSGANPFGSSTTTTQAKPEPTKEKEEEEKSSSSLTQSFAETLSLNNPTPTPKSPPKPEPWPAEESLPKAYPTLYLVDVDYETLDPIPTTSSSSQQHARMDIDNTGTEKDEVEALEAFKSSMDATFQKFADRMAQNPEQVIRYEFAGKPLLYTKEDAVGRLLLADRLLPRCGSCGAHRTFEMQLTPHAIAELEAEELSLEGMEWGTVIVAVCDRDCQAYGVEDGEVGYVEEWAGVQWEELKKRT